MYIEKLEWDTEFFKFDVGKAVIGDDVYDLDFSREAYKLIYFYVDPLNEKVNKQSTEMGALLTDEKITYAKKIYPNNSLTPDIVSYQEGLHNREKVIDIGLQSGHYSRFCIDPNFEKEKFKELYTIWLHKSMDRTLAKEVFLAISDEDISGVITVGQKDGRADIGILAVDEKQRGKKLGHQLVTKAEQFAYEQLFSDLQVVTQRENKDACRFYERCGFYIDSIVNIYHLWKL